MEGFATSPWLFSCLLVTVSWVSGHIGQFSGCCQSLLFICSRLLFIQAVIYPSLDCEADRTEERERTFRFFPLSRSSCNLIVIHIIEKLWNNNDPTICLDTNFGNGRGYTAFQPQSSSRDFSKRIFSIEKRSFFPNQFSVAIEIPLLWSWIFFLSSRHSFNFVMKPEQ